jgi:4-amino-4-deoxy-L-arabinose transferase-like glycosyltransferase
MLIVRKYRICAPFCALSVLLCELISRPYANMGISDDGPYILIARHLAATGHIFYNGNTTPLLGWQLYVGAAFIKLLGFSFTSVRMSTLLVAMLLAFVLQRTFVLAGVTDRNAMIGTLALVLSPLYLMLSATFMSDVTGLFAIVLCLYSCLRALQASTERSATASPSINCLLRPYPVCPCSLLPLAGRLSGNPLRRQGHTLSQTLSSALTVLGVREALHRP